MRLQEVNIRPLGYDTRGVDVAMAGKVVILDMVHVDGACHAGYLIELAGVRPKMGVVHQALFVGFEVAIIHGIESDQRGKQAPVCFGDLAANEVALFG